MKCKHCEKKLTKKQKLFCSRECHYKNRAEIVKNSKHTCLDCDIEMKKQVSKHWRCQNCTRKVGRKMYHERYKDSRKIQMSEYYKKNRKKMLANQLINGKRRNKELRISTLKAYGNKCDCCGEKKIEFLCIDHIGGGGSKHRKTLKSGIYVFLKQNGYPKGYRVLCHNCNMSLGFYGYCPHRKLKII